MNCMLKNITIKLITLFSFSFWLTSAMSLQTPPTPPDFVWRFDVTAPDVKYTGPDGRGQYTIFRDGFIVNERGDDNVVTHVDNPRPGNDPFVSTSSEQGNKTEGALHFAYARRGAPKPESAGKIVGYLYHIRATRDLWEVMASLNYAYTTAKSKGLPNYANRISSVMEDYDNEYEWIYYGSLPTKLIKEAIPVVSNGTEYIPDIAHIIQNGQYENDSTIGNSNPFRFSLPKRDWRDDSDEGSDGYGMGSKPYASYGGCYPTSSAYKNDATDACTQEKKKVMTFYFYYGNQNLMLLLLD